MKYFDKYLTLKIQLDLVYSYDEYKCLYVD